MKVKITSENIKNTLKKAIHPELNKSLVELAMIRKVEISDNTIVVTLVIPFEYVPIKADLVKIVKDTIRKKYSNKIKVLVKEMNKEEKKIFGDLVKQVRGSSL